MAKPVTSAAEAVRIARNLATNSGLFWFNITKANRSGTRWIVNVESFSSKYQAIISARTGEVIEWKKS